jgi:multiple sugar transport system substrate-binding protein
VEKRIRIVVFLVLTGSLLIFSGLAQAKRTLTFWCGYPELKPVYEVAKADFEKANPDIEVKLEFFPLRGFVEKLNVTLPTRTGPDIAEINSHIAGKFIDGGLLMETPKEIVKDIKQNIFPEYFPSALWGKKYYGFPVCYFSELLFWNKTMFKEAGLPGPPATYDELIDYARKLTKYDAAGNITRSGFSMRIAGSAAGTMEKFWAMGLIPNGAHYLKKISENKYDVGFTKKELEWGIKLYIDMLYKYKVDNYIMKHDSEAFALGQTAMFQREQWVAGYLKQNAPNLDYGIAHLPQNKSLGTWVKTRSLFVPKASKNQPEAWKFIEFFFHPKYQAMMVKDTGWMSTRKDLDYAEILKDTPELLTVIKYPKGMKIQWDVINPATDEVNGKAGEVLLKAFRDKTLLDNPKGVSKVADEMIAEIRTVLKNYGLY